MKKNRSSQGSALLMVLILTVILVGISFAFMTLSYISLQKSISETRSLQAQYLAESAAAGKLTDWNSGTTAAPAPRPTNINAVQIMGGGAYVVPQGTFVDFTNATPSDSNYVSFQVVTWYPVDPVGDAAYITTLNNYYLNTPTALNPPPPKSKDMIMRKVDFLLSRAGGGVYWNAIYAGNSGAATNDLYNGQAYSLQLTGVTNGTTTLADQVWGSIYSGGGINASSPASILDYTGSKTSTGSVTYNGGSGSNTSSLSGPNYTQGNEPAPAINRNTSGQTDWETKTLSLNASGTRTDPATGITYIDVADDLNSKGSSGKWVDGSSAVQITDQTQPSHIFRQNPTSVSSTKNRTTSYEYTYTNPIATGAKTNVTKNDYYLEDPTSSAMTHPSLTGVAVNGDTTASAVNVQPNGNNAVYFIDGNMRVSGEDIRSYQLTPTTGTGALSMTMVVKGNVSLTDNVLYPTWQSQTDALAIIAVQDPNFPNHTSADFAQAGSTVLSGPSGLTIDQFVAQYNALTQQGINNGSNLTLLPTTGTSTWTPAQRDLAAQEYNKTYGSGNVYFGDPGSGTVEHFEGYLYAENDFYGEALNATSSNGGTKDLEIWGNMTAGNQIRINRSLTNTGGGGANYIPLSVKFDPSIMNGGAHPPGLPPTPGFGSGAWFVASSRVAP